MQLQAIDQIGLNFDPRGLAIINVAIGVMMLGVAIDLRPSDFRRVLESPRAPLIGLMAQFVLLPAATFLLTLVIRPQPSMALGMILVASCPGGNLSNIMTWLAKGNTALSISMTAVSSFAAIIMTPLNLSLWGSLNPQTAPILRAVSLSPRELFGTVVLILGLPLALGLLLSRRFPGLAARVRKPLRLFSLAFFVLVVAGALAANWHNFLNYVGAVLVVVMLHNALALNIGYWTARAARLATADCRAVAIEVGIQNSALGLILVFNFFDGLGGMALVTAWWGVWHVVGGLAAALLFTRFGRASVRRAQGASP